MKKIILLNILLMSGCARPPTALIGLRGGLRGVRAADMDAWKGVSVTILLTHPLFSTFAAYYAVLAKQSRIAHFF